MLIVRCMKLSIRQCSTETDMRHEKTDLEVFVIVIPKEGWAGWGMTPTIKYLLYCLHRLYSVVGVLPKEGLAGGYDNDKDLLGLFSYDACHV